MTTQRLISRYRESLIGLFDQALVSILTFGSTLIAGKLLPADEFSKYAVILSAAAFGQLTIAAFVTSPSIYHITNNKRRINTPYLLSLTSIAAALTATIGGISLLGIQLLASLGLLDIASALLLGFSWGVFDLARRVFLSSTNRFLSLYTSCTAVLSMSCIIAPQLLSDHISHQSLVLTLSASYLISTLIFGAVFASRTTDKAHARGDNGTTGTFWSDTRDLIRHGLPLFSGMLAYWTYSHGAIIFMSKVLDQSDFNQIRLYIAVCSISSIPLAYIENNFTPRLGAASSTSRDEYAGALKALNSTTVELAILYLTIGFPSFAAFIYFTYTDKYGSNSWDALFILSLSQSLLIWSRDAIVRSRSMGVSSVTFVGHLSSLFTFVLTAALLSRNPSLTYAALMLFVVAASFCVFTNIASIKSHK